ncbi:MAG: hypothetical protein R6U57_05255 [Anaerolineales bacterium]
MKIVLEQIEISWWHFHIRLLDESDVLRSILPYVRVIWLQRKEIARSIVWAALGLPLGLLLGLLKAVTH